MATQFLLATDLDHTLMGDDRATIALTQALSSIRHCFYLIYATGRSVTSVQDLMNDFWHTTGIHLLEPDYLVAGVGSTIYQQGRLDSGWAKRLSQNWQREAIATRLDAVPELALQPQREQNPWKLSYYVKSQHNAQVVEALKSQLADAQLAAQVIFSSDRDVDILPSNSGKGEAVTYLREQLQITRERTLVCGDSGNDITMFQQKTLGAIVSNAQPELITWHQSYPDPMHYLAQSAYAGGILEAMTHFNLTSLPLEVNPLSCPERHKF